MRTGHRTACAKRGRRSVAMALGGRQSKRVRSIPPIEVTHGASSRMLKRLDIAGAPQQPEHQELLPIAENSSGCDNAVQEEPPAVAENTSYYENLNGCSTPLRDWTPYPDDGNSLNKDETGQNTDSG
jgi:hypothetical protein